MAEQKEQIYIKFQLDAVLSSTRKTNVWEVVTDDLKHSLGFIKWYGNWRGYAFFPGYATIFEQKCLRHIAEFIEKCNHDHGQQLKNEKAEI